MFKNCFFPRFQFESLNSFLKTEITCKLDNHSGRWNLSILWQLMQCKVSSSPKHWCLGTLQKPFPWSLSAILITQSWSPATSHCKYREATCQVQGWGPDSRPVWPLTRLLGPGHLSNPAYSPTEERLMALALVTSEGPCENQTYQFM